MKIRDHIRNALLPLILMLLVANMILLVMQVFNLPGQPEEITYNCHWAIPDQQLTCREAGR